MNDTLGCVSKYFYANTQVLKTVASVRGSEDVIPSRSQFQHQTETGREGGRRKESRKEKKSKEKRDLRLLNTEENGGEPLVHTRENL